MDPFVPQRMFFTKGVGAHAGKLQSLEGALRDAGIEKCNLVLVSSILPPDCEIISRERGIAQLVPGQITFCVMAKETTNEPNRLVSAAIGLARPRDQGRYGYISEHHAVGETMEQSAGFAEDLAATMLTSSMGIERNLDAASGARDRGDELGDTRYVTRSTAQSARGHKNGLWTTVIAAAVFLIS